MTRNGPRAAGGRAQAVSALSLLAALLSVLSVVLPWTSSVATVTAAYAEPSVSAVTWNPLSKPAYGVPLSIAVSLLLAAGVCGALATRSARWRTPTQVTAVAGTGVLVGSVGAVWVAYLAEVAYPSGGDEDLLPGTGLWLFLVAALAAVAATTTVVLAENWSPRGAALTR